MDWKNTKLPSGSKLFKVHNFNFIHKGVNFLLEVDEYNDGTYTGHGEHSTDQNYFIESVSGKSMHECLNELVTRIQSRA